MDSRKKKSGASGRRPVEPVRNSGRNTALQGRNASSSGNVKSHAGTNSRANQQRQLTPEQRRRTNQAYHKATVHRDVKSKRRGRRGGNYVMYYILGAAVIITVLIILSNTLLFNCTSIEVEGNSRYTAEQLITQSGIEKGQNLLHIDVDSAQSRIFAAFPYIDDVEVQKSFPTKVKIVVQEAEKWFQVSSGGVNAAVSRMGRIVELGSTPGLPVIEGYDPTDISPGIKLTSKEAGKTDLPAQILEAAEENGIAGVSHIDLTDRFDITIDCGDNITLEIGGASDLGIKFAEASAAIKQEHSNVVIDLRAQEKIFVRNKNDQEQVLPDLGPTSEGTAEAGSAEVTAEQ